MAKYLRSDEPVVREVIACWNRRHHGEWSTGFDLSCIRVERTGRVSAGQYVCDTKTVLLHPMATERTLAHEVVHALQCISGEVYGGEAEAEEIAEEVEKLGGPFRKNSPSFRRRQGAPRVLRGLGKRRDGPPGTAFP